MMKRTPDPGFRYLDQAGPGDRFQVRMTALEFLPQSMSHLPLPMGDEFRHVERHPDGVVVERPNGERLLIPDSAIQFIGVRPLN